LSVRRFLAKNRLTRQAWAAARSVRHSSCVRYISEMPFYPHDRILQRQNRGHFAFDVTGSIGMGGILTHVIRLSKYADQNSLIPVVRCTGALYATERGRDWFQKLFVPKISVSIETANRLRFLSVQTDQSYGAFSVPKVMTILEANRLFDKYFGFHPDVHSVVESVLTKGGVRQFDLSLHYRGTDKRLEAGEVPFEILDEKISQLQARGIRIVNVFLATDSVAFDVFIRRRRPDFNFTSLQFGELNRDDAPRHFSNINPELKAIEAVGNMRLIGMAQYCIRTASYLSAWSKIFNPNLKVSTLNTLTDKSVRFPEQEILDGGF
jgi:hypothetical protein